MKRFSTKDSQIIWAKKHGLLEGDMQAIREDIVCMLAEIQETMEFTKKLRSVDREVEAKIYFNKDLSKDCWLIVYYEQSCEAWAMLIIDKSQKTIGEIASQNLTTMPFIKKENVLRQESIE